MKRRSRTRAVRLAVALLCAALGGWTPSGGAPPQQAERPLRVLFLGNSHTYYNNLPRIVEQLAESAGGRRMETTLAAWGGASLRDHLANARLREAVRSGGWDWVVLQEQGSLGALYLVNGRSRIARPEPFFEAARQLDAEIRAAGARTMFYHLWARREDAAADWRMLDFAYTHIARELGAAVAPVGPAWQRARREAPHIPLHDPDGSHPSPAGSYLAGCVFYAVLAGRSPAGLTARITGYAYDRNTGLTRSAEPVLLVDLEPRRAAALQRIAWQTVERLRKAGGYGKAERPPPPEAPSMPAGRAPAAAELEGAWSGPLRLFPQPGRLELRFARADQAWRIALAIRFDGRREDISGQASAPVFTERGFAFTFAAQNGTLKFQGTVVDGRLAGIAEFMARDGPAYAIGSWEAARAP